MSFSTRKTLMAASALVLSGCATANPDVMCTANWIEARADRAVGELSRDTRGAVEALLDVGGSYAGGNEPGLFSLLRLRGAIDQLERELSGGSGIRDLRTLARTCDEPDIVARGLFRWLDAQGLPSALEAFVADSGLLDRFLDDDDRT